MAKIEITQPPSGGGGGTVNAGVLQVLGGGAVTSTTKTVTDQLGTLSALQVSTGTVSVTPGGVLYGSTAILSVRGNTSSGGIAFEATNSAGTSILQANDGGQVNILNKLAVGPVLSTPSDQTISLTTVASTDNLRNFVGKNISDTAGLQPFKVNGGRARGTSTTPTAVQANDGLASFNGFGHNGADWTPTRGGMYIYAAENWGLLAQGTYITWRGVAAGSTTVTEWARLQSTGLTISTIANATTDTDKFLVSDSGVIKYRTGTELLSDLGISNPVTGSGVSGRLTYWNGINSVTSDADLVWSAANTRLGIGVASPTQRLEVIGNTKTTGLIISTATAQTTASTQYLSLDATDSTVKYRTPAQVLSDIGAQATLTNPVTGTGTATRVAFWSSGSAISSSSMLYWDDTNNRLGINTTTPTGKLSIVGTGSTTGTALIIQNSTPTTLFTVNDSGLITSFAPSTTVLTGTTEIIKSTSSFIAPSNGGGSFRPLSINYTINNTGTQTGTATGIYLNATQTALGGMTHNLINLTTGAGGTSFFRVNTDGNSYFDQGAVTIYNGVILTNAALMRIGVTTPSIYLATATNANFGMSSTGVSITQASFANPAASAILDIVSTTRGFLLPRMTTAQRTAIASPANGLMVYDTDLGQPCFYDTVNTRWNKISHSVA